MKKEYKPGPGWKEIKHPVYQKGVIRIHVSGDMVKSMILNKTINVEEKSRIFIKINGGNRKRGLMAYANHVRFGV